MSFRNNNNDQLILEELMRAMPQLTDRNQLIYYLYLQTFRLFF